MVSTILSGLRKCCIEQEGCIRHAIIRGITRAVRRMHRTALAYMKVRNLYGSRHHFCLMLA